MEIVAKAVWLGSCINEDCEGNCPSAAFLCMKSYGLGPSNSNGENLCIFSTVLWSRESDHCSNNYNLLRYGCTEGCSKISWIESQMKISWGEQTKKQKSSGHVNEKNFLRIPFQIWTNS